MTLKAVFVDIGGTLGDRDPTTGALAAYPSSAGMLRSFRDVLGLRIGAITTLGALSNAQALELLKQAGLAQYIDAAGLVSEHDTGGIAKPDPRIYAHAARRFDLHPEDCLFLGENLLEVVGALTAGMKAVLKPSPPGRDLGA
jgi:FMN phosphatase YigB (HAD superfamily)